MEQKTAWRGGLFFCAFLLFATASFAQNITILGKVTDQNGNGLEGVTVQVKGTNIATKTAKNGVYQIAVPSEKSVLLVSHVGFDEQELTVGSQREIGFSLKASANTMEDVVVIGYGTRKRSDVTGSVSTLKNENFQERAISRVDQALVGQLAGVTVKQTTGVPGKAFSIQVRGSGSISGGNEPLYVIDGFPLSVNSSNTTNGTFTTGNPLDNINPNDIESIEVLKDAAAAAIYGSRASNGVVLITTKKGQTGKPKISFNNYAGYNEAAKKLDMLYGYDWIDRATEIINATYVAKAGAFGATANDDDATRRAKLTLAGVPLSGTQINTSYMLDPRWSIKDHPGLAFHDWQDEIERKGIMQNHEISASGGTESVRYFISGNYVNQDGYVKFMNYKAYSARANVELTVSKRLKFGVNVAPTYSITTDPGVDGKDNIFHQALSMTPVQEDTVGKYPNIGKNAQYSWSNSVNGSLGKLENNKGLTKRYRTLGTIFGDVQIVKGLSFRTSVNLDNTDNVTTGYFPYVATGSLASRTFTGSNNLLAGTSGSYVSYRRQTFVNENTLTYNKVFEAIRTNLNVLAGHSYNLDRFDRTQLNSSGGYTSAVIQTLNAAAAVTGNTTATKSILISYFTRVQLGYNEKYLLTASLRRDGSSRFGINNQFGVFPSASLAWRVTGEDFMKSLSVISDLKLRVSYGVNGNNNLPNDYASIATIGSSGYVFGTPAAVIGQVPNVLANPDLKWERSQTYDAGLDFGILGNRITGSFDYYNKLNTDLLLNVQVPEVTGFQTYLTNIGEVRNIGQELELSSRNLVNAFKWNTTINLSHNTNKIEALAPGQLQIIIPNGFTVSDQILRVGSPLNSIYVLKRQGFLSQADITNHVATYGPNETVGDPKYVDTNGDGVITEADKQILGHPNPNYTYGITNNFRYKGFDLNVLVQGQFGGSIYSQLGRALTRPGQGFNDNAPASYKKRWKSPTDQGEGRFGKAYSTFNSPIVADDSWLYSSDYIRVRNITLGYNLKNIWKTPYVQGARIYVTLENFFGHDKYYNGLNPEASNTAISSNSALYPESGDYGGMPLAKSLILGLNITF
jgi:TonB-linked SusC/RagA family outer membrane protein